MMKLGPDVKKDTKKMETRNSLFAIGHSSDQCRDEEVNCYGHEKYYGNGS